MWVQCGCKILFLESSIFQIWGSLKLEILGFVIPKTLEGIMLGKTVLMCFSIK